MSSRELDEAAILDVARQILAAEARASYLDHVCAGDQALRERVEALLQVHEQEFLASEPAPTVAAKPITESVGQQIGRYKLMQQIGEGGMGVVFVAQQERPIRRKVALKIIKPGMDTKEVIARFDAERQALALMDHPNIAKVLDAGTTESGRPYFVMELVRGVAITEYCDLNKFSAAQRIALFVHVCHAVQHAHQKGVIHRDLKPSNVLITEHDGDPIVKVIDFGVAKSINQQLTERTIYTRFQQMVGTPMYMSPEQAELSGLDVDTRTDIYSLSVMLYELLTGTTPFDKKHFSQVAYDEMRRIIREVEPPKPSTRVGSLGDSATSISDRRQTDPRKLRRLLRGDLDWIVMKAMEKDRSRRYESANGFARDLERFLQNEPVEARSPSVGYRFTKFARRNKTAVITTGAFSAILVLGTVLASWQAYVASRQRDRAELAESLAHEQAELAKESEKQARIEAERATASELEARRGQYIADMNVVQHDWERNNIARARRLLAETQNYPDRGFEWDYWQRQMHREVRTFAVHLAPIWNIAFSPDGNSLATACEDSTARIWDIATGRELFPLRHAGGVVRTVDFSLEGDRILTAGEDQTARIWDTKTGRELLVIQDDAGVASAHFSPDGRRIIAGSTDKTAKVRDAFTGEKLFSLMGHSGVVWATAFSPDGQRIVTGARNDTTARVWDASNGQLLHLLEHDYGVNCVAFSPNSSRIVTGPWGGTASVWDTGSGERLLRLTGHTVGIWAAEFSPDGGRIVTGSGDQTAKIWDAVTGDELQTFKGHTFAVTAAAFSRDGRRIATGSFWNATVKLWEANEAHKPLALDGHAGASAVAFLPDGALPGGPWIVTGGFSDGTARIADASTGWTKHTLRGHTAPIGAVAVSQDGRWVVTGSDDQTARIWDISTGQQRRILEGHTSGITSVVVSRDGGRIVTGSNDGTAILWDASNGEQLKRFIGHKAGALSVAIEPDGKWIVTGASGDGTAIVWDSSTGRTRLRLEGDETVGVRGIAVSPDGRRIVGGVWANATGFVWDAATGQTLFLLKGHKNPISSVAFSPDGQRILTGARDWTAKLWEATSGRELLTFREHTRSVESVAFSPNGQQIATAGGDATLVWRSAPPGQVAAWQAEDETAAEREAALKRERGKAEEHDRTVRQIDEGSIKRWLMLGPIEVSEDETSEQSLERKQVTGTPAQAKARRSPDDWR